ncbi:uncharacterized protein [Dendrobates tinctorius]|uniref:uncharacterized protein isoform X2 n=1 Tax=Dendrobates tinctorius TaxID=92724 RepID=UPI003CC97911
MFRITSHQRPYSARMGMDKSSTTEQVLYHIMEMLYLLTGEDYIVVKKPGRQSTHNRLLVVEGISRTMANVLPTPSRPVTSHKETEQKILELTNKITELLTGEVPIRCDDVTIHFSMEEWEYIEGNKDLYQDVSKKHQNIELLGDPICKNSLLHNGASDLLNQDDMMKNLNVHDPGVMQNVSSANFTENISACKDRSFSNVDHTNYSCMRIKEETCDDSYDGGNVPTPHSSVQFHSVQIKEEPISYDGGHLTNLTPMDHTQHHTVEEPSSYVEPQINTYTPTDHVQHHPYLHIVEQQSTYGETPPNMYTSTDHAQHHPSPHTAEEQSSYGGQNLLQPNMLPPADPSQYPFTHIIMNAVSRERGKQANTDHRNQYSAGDTMEKLSSSNKVSVSCKDLNLKTLSYPVRQSTATLVQQIKPAPCSKKRHGNVKNTVESSTGSEHHQMDVDVDDEKNSSSVYSVRQSDNAMEILYHCPSCQKGFYSNLELVRHQVTHSVDKLFVCALCGKSFTELSFLVKHQVFHTDLKLCVCKVCGGCFYSEASLAKHEKTHSSPVHCFNCGKCFFSKTELEIHKRKHTLEKPYGCHVCGKHFITKYVHDKHMLCHTKVELSGGR